MALPRASTLLRAVEWAVRTGGLIIEDDYDGELRYDRPSVGALQALAPEHVVYAGTASKSLVPGLRLGWLVLPEHLVGDVVEAKESMGRLSSSLDQLTLAEFIASGAFDRQVRHARLTYRRRRDALVAALARQAPQVRVTGIAAGLHALVQLPAGQREDDLVARAARHGLGIEGLSAAYGTNDAYSTATASSTHFPMLVGTQHGPALIIGYATPPGHAFSTALARLGAEDAPGGPRTAAARNRIRSC